MTTETAVEQAQCQDCGEIVDVDQLDLIAQVFQRVAPGEPMPAGQCPHCGALARPYSSDEYDPLAKLYIEVDRLRSAYDDEPGYRSGTVVINGVDFHLEAIEIVPCGCHDDNDARHWCSDTHAVSDIRESQLREVYTAWGGEGPWTCIRNRGKLWIVWLFPHCS